MLGIWVAKRLQKGCKTQAKKRATYQSSPGGNEAIMP